jgi:hypothetical protein
MKATKTLIKREALRVFGQRAEAYCTIELDHPFGMRAAWLLTLSVGDLLELRVSGLTKQGALEDALELLGGLAPTGSVRAELTKLEVEVRDVLKAELDRRREST